MTGRRDHKTRRPPKDTTMTNDTNETTNTTGTYCRFIVRRQSDFLGRNNYWLYDGDEFVIFKLTRIQVIKAARAIAKDGDSIEFIDGNGIVVGRDTFKINAAVAL